VLTLVLSSEDVVDLECVNEIPEEEGVNYLRRTEQIMQLVVNKKDTYRVREDIELPANKPNISDILWYTVSLKSMNTKLYNGKVGVQGELVLFMLYHDEEEDSPVQWLESVVPYDGEIEVNDCDEDMIGDIETAIVSAVVNLKPDYDGEQRMIELEVVLELTMKIYNENDFDVLCDLYSTKNQLTPKYEDISYSTLCMKNISKCKVNDKLKLDKELGNVMQLLSAQGTAYMDDMEITEKGIAVQGIVKIKIMYVSSDDSLPINIADEIVPFEHTIEAEGVKEDSFVFIRPSLEQISTVMSGNNEIEVKCTAVLDTLVLDNHTSKFITDVESCPFDLKELQAIPSMAGYVVKEKDTLWDIAKRYCTTKPSIMKMNEMKSEKITKGDMLVIIKETL
jgi:LysM repeat protein